MPQLVRDLRYCSHCEAGVEMGESMSLEGWLGQVETRSVAGRGAGGLPVASLYIVIVAA